MCDNNEHKKNEFLKFAINRLESRIDLIDKKADILIAINAGLIALAGFLTQIFWKDSSSGVKPIGCLLLSIFLLWSLLIILLLLWTVRPTKHLLGLRGRLSKLEKVSYDLLWPSESFCCCRDWYNNAFQSLPQAIQDNLQETHYALLQLIDRKYRYYSWAIPFMKILVAVSLIVILIIELIWLCVKFCAD